MITFAIGVALLGGIVFVFGSLESDIMEDIREPQSMEVLNYVASLSSSLVRLNATSSYVKMTLPRRISGVTYKISGNGIGDKIVLSTTETSVNVSSPAQFIGEFDSNYERAMIQYEKGKLTIRGVSD